MRAQIKYVVDEMGYKRETIVPISLWEKLYKVKSKISKRIITSDLMDFFGKVRINIDPLRFQKEIRNEWE